MKIVLHKNKIYKGDYLEYIHKDINNALNTVLLEMFPKCEPKNLKSLDVATGRNFYPCLFFKKFGLKRENIFAINNGEPEKWSVEINKPIIGLFENYKPNIKFDIILFHASLIGGSTLLGEIHTIANIDYRTLEKIGNELETGKPVDVSEAEFRIAKSTVEHALSLLNSNGVVIIIPARYAVQRTSFSDPLEILKIDIVSMEKTVKSFKDDRRLTEMHIYAKTEEAKNAFLDKFFIKEVSSPWSLSKRDVSPETYKEKIVRLIDAVVLKKA